MAIHIYICINIHTHTYIYIPDIGLAVRVFANGPGDLGSIPGRVIPKTQKMVLDASLLNTQHYKVRIKGKVEQSREGVAPSPTPWCSSYRKGSLRVTLDNGRQLYYYIYKYIYTRRYIHINKYVHKLIYIYIYIYAHIYIHIYTHISIYLFIYIYIYNFIFPTEIALTTKLPDIVIWPDKAKSFLYCVNGLVPSEEIFDWAHQRKLEKYKNLREQCVRNGWIRNVFVIKVGCRGFIANSTSVFLTNLKLPPSNK